MEYRGAFTDYKIRWKNDTKEITYLIRGITSD